MKMGMWLENVGQRISNTGNTSLQNTVKHVVVSSISAGWQVDVRFRFCGGCSVLPCHKEASLPIPVKVRWMIHKKHLVCCVGSKFQCIKETAVTCWHATSLSGVPKFHGRFLLKHGIVSHGSPLSCSFVDEFCWLIGSPMVGFWQYLADQEGSIPSYLIFVCIIFWANPCFWRLILIWLGPDWGTFFLHCCWTTNPPGSGRFPLQPMQW